MKSPKQMKKISIALTTITLLTTNSQVFSTEALVDEADTQVTRKKSVTSLPLVDNDQGVKQSSRYLRKKNNFLKKFGVPSFMRISAIKFLFQKKDDYPKLLILKLPTDRELYQKEKDARIITKNRISSIGKLKSNPDPTIMEILKTKNNNKLRTILQIEAAKEVLAHEAEENRKWSNEKPLILYNDPRKLDRYIREM